MMVGAGPVVGVRPAFGGSGGLGRGGATTREEFFCHNPVWKPRGVGRPLLADLAEVGSWRCFWLVDDADRETSNFGCLGCSPLAAACWLLLALALAGFGFGWLWLVLAGFAWPALAGFARL